MASYSDKVAWWSEWRCAPEKMTGVLFPGWGTPLLVADAAAPAFEVFADLMRTHRYNFRESAGGTYNCRKIAGSSSWSLHAYGLAIDLNPSANPYGTHRHDYPQGFIDDVLATGVFKWGIDFDDPMHWEIDVPPDQIEDDMALTQDDVDRIATAVVARVLTDSANYSDPPGLGRQVQLIRATVNATAKAVNSLDTIDSAQLARDIAAELEFDGIPKATADLIAARLAG